MPKVKKARKRRHAQAVGSTRRGLGVYSHDTFAATRSQTDSTATSTAASATTTTIAATSNMAGPPSGITLLSNQGRVRRRYFQPMCACLHTPRSIYMMGDMSAHCPSFYLSLRLFCTTHKFIHIYICMYININIPTHT